MSDHSRLFLVAALAAILGGGGGLAADDDVTVVSSSPSNAKAKQTSSETNADGTPVVHKSSHKKKTATQVAATPSSYGNGAAAAPPVHTTTGFASTMPHPVQFPPVYHPLPSAAPGMLPRGTATAVTPAATTVSPGSTSANAPAVDTGLPVARYPGIAAAIPGVSTYQPAVHTYIASTTAMTGATLATTAVATYSVPYRPAPPPLSDFSFSSPVKGYHNFYPWKTGIVTTSFWIGEGSTPISSTDNVESSWDEEWLQKNHGSDNPYNRSGYASGSHASTLNPFYCALPFNDLAFPDQARVWLPRGWYRRPIEGKQISACKDRWVEIKNSRGDFCYAQWEDVGPLRYDDAAYVFGGERPIGLADDRAGLDVSPAVYDYLGLGDRNHFTSWRFVDEADVRPGAWLKLDEQAVIFTALEQLKNHPLPSEPIQRSSEPIDDATLQANKKKVERAN